MQSCSVQTRPYQQTCKLTMLKKTEAYPLGRASVSEIQIKNNPKITFKNTMKKSIYEFTYEYIFKLALTSFDLSSSRVFSVEQYATQAHIAGIMPCSSLLPIACKTPSRQSPPSHRLHSYKAHRYNSTASWDGRRVGEWCHRRS